MANPSTDLPVKALYIQVPVGIPTGDGGLEIPNRVFLGGISTETTELELELFFSVYGAVRDVRIVFDRYTGENKGYGFVTFDDHEDISKLLAARSVTMKGKRLRVRKAVRRNGSQFDNTGSNGQTSPITQPAEQYVMVQQQYMQHVSPPYQTYPNIPVSTANQVPYNSAPVQHHQNMQPLYYVPYINSAQPPPFSMLAPMMQQMQIS